jgi:hypothetical protein
VASLQGQYPGMSLQDAAARVELMATLAEGSMFRQGIAMAPDPERLAALYHTVIALVFGPPR